MGVPILTRYKSIPYISLYEYMAPMCVASINKIEQKNNKGNNYRT